MLLRQGESFLK